MWEEVYEQNYRIKKLGLSVAGTMALIPFQNANNVPLNITAWKNTGFTDVKIQNCS